VRRDDPQNRRREAEQQRHRRHKREQPAEHDKSLDAS
jgi:hypothetical protein